MFIKVYNQHFYKITENITGLFTNYFQRDNTLTEREIIYNKNEKRTLVEKITGLAP